MIGTIIESRGVVAVPWTAVATEPRRRTAQAAQDRRRAPSLVAAPRRRWLVGLSGAGDASLRWLIDSVLLGLAYAAAAHGPVSPDALHEVHAMRQRQRRP